MQLRGMLFKDTPSGVPKPGFCVVMLEPKAEEAVRAAELLAEYPSAGLVSYERVLELKTHPPSGVVTMFLVAAAQQPLETLRVLRWLKRNWPRTPVAVLGDAGAGTQEQVARQSGAMYFLRPLNDQQLHALVVEPVDRQLKLQTVVSVL